MIAFHGIISAYGFWLPNDPRGSWSDFVASWELFLAGGPATKVSTTRSVAHRSHDHSQRLATKQFLKRPAVKFNGPQAVVISQGFRRAVESAGHKIWACAIMPDHCHFVIGVSRYSAERILGHLKREAALALKVAGNHPFQREFLSTGVLPECWAEGRWKVFLDTNEDVVRAIKYVEKNPDRAGLRRQRWSFVSRFPG
jgi:REP element-mobilizing transposase RayT